MERINILKMYNYNENEINKLYNLAYDSTHLWIKKHQEQYQDYLSTIIKNEDKGFIPLEHYVNQLFYYESKNTYISLGFNKSINYSMSMDDLQQSIKYICLDKIPLPNFVIPNKWDIHPLTPISSINSDKINILSFENGKIKIHVKADFFAIYGKLKDIHIACGPMPKGTYFCIKNHLKSDIFIQLPITIKN